MRADAVWTPAGILAALGSRMIRQLIEFHASDPTRFPAPFPASPIAQAVPILRESWEPRAVPWDAEARQEIEREMQAERHDFYKDRHWKKKSYG